MQLWHISCREIVLITPPSRNKLLKLHPPPFVPYTLEGAIAMITRRGGGEGDCFERFSRWELVDGVNSKLFGEFQRQIATEEAVHIIMGSFGRQVANDIFFQTIILHRSRARARSIESPFIIADSVYGSILFVTTEFHDLHVLIETLFLIIILWCMTNPPFLHFEAAAWYWHFIVAWLLFYLSIYWWGCY